MTTTTPAANERIGTEHEFPAHYMPAMPPVALVEFGRRVLGSLDQSK